MWELLQLSNQFLKLAAGSYTESIKKIVEQSAARNKFPFRSWFDGNSRVYLPLQKVSYDFSENDKAIIALLLRLGYQNIDYIAGQAFKDNKPIGIGKILSKLRREEGELKKNERAIRYFERLALSFANSAVRHGGKDIDDLLVVISQDPHDLAKMSTERGWKSCMTLDEPGKGSEKGDKWQEVFCEVSTGGLIAYLIRSYDEDIRHPLARVLLRRYSNAQNKSFLKLEERVYGANVPGFLTTVQSWIDRHQGPIPLGSYTLEGMDWSDSVPGEFELFESIDQDQKVDDHQLTRRIENYGILNKDEKKKLVDYITKNYQENGSDSDDIYISRFTVLSLIEAIIDAKDYHLFDFNLDKFANPAQLKDISKQLFRGDAIDKFPELKQTKLYQNMMLEDKDDAMRVFHKTMRNLKVEYNAYDINSAVYRYLKILPISEVISTSIRIIKDLENKMCSLIACSMFEVIEENNMQDIKSLFFIQKYLGSFFERAFDFGIRQVGEYFIKCAGKAKLLLPWLKEQKQKQAITERDKTLFDVVIQSIEDNNPALLPKFSALKG